MSLSERKRLFFVIYVVKFTCIKKFFVQKICNIFVTNTLQGCNDMLYL